MGLLLQSCLGGSASDLCVAQIGDRVFRFKVSSKAVGFHIYHLKSYQCDSFVVYFNLWSEGGPRSEIEAQRWEQEQDSEWTLVTNRKKEKQQRKLTYAEIAKKNGSVRLTDANSIPLQFNRQASIGTVFQRIKSALPQKNKSVFDRLQFPKASVFDRIIFPVDNPVKASAKNTGDHGKQAVVDQGARFQNLTPDGLPLIKELMDLEYTVPDV